MPDDAARKVADIERAIRLSHSGAHSCTQPCPAMLFDSIIRPLLAERDALRDGESILREIAKRGCAGPSMPCASLGIHDPLLACQECGASWVIARLDRERAALTTPATAGQPQETTDDE